METSNIEVKIGSEKAFGITFCVVFALLGLYNPVSATWWYYTFFGLSAAMLVLGLWAPSVLAVPNRWWFRFGMLLGAIIAPITMGIIFILVLVPTGLLMRTFKRDSLGIRFNDSPSYWIVREDPSIDMKKQF